MKYWIYFFLEMWSRNTHHQFYPATSFGRLDWTDKATIQNKGKKKVDYHINSK